MPSFSQRSIRALQSCDYRLQGILHEAIQHIDFIVLEGHRDQIAQNEAFRTGKSKLKWPNGKHNSLPSKAVDVMPYYPDIKISWKDVPAIARLMGYIQCIADRRGIKLRFGLDWDGDWKTAAIGDDDERFLDAPHIELVD